MAQSIDELLREAKASLARSEQFLRDVGADKGVMSHEEATAPTTAKMPTARGALRGFTEMLAKPAPALGTAAMGSALTGIGAPLAPYLGAASMLSAGPNVIRQALLPDEDESRAAALGEGALYAAAPAIGKFGPAISQTVKNALGSMRGLSNATKPAGWVGKSVASGYGGVGKNVSNFDEAASAVDDVSPELPESWKQFVQPKSFRGKAEPVASARNPKDMLATMSRESEAGYRNVPHSDNPLMDLLPEGGLGSITPAEWKKLGLRQVPEDLQFHQNPAAKWSEDLFEQLAQREGRLSIPARARAFQEQK